MDDIALEARYKKASASWHEIEDFLVEQRNKARARAKLWKQAAKKYFEVKP